MQRLLAQPHLSNAGMNIHKKRANKTILMCSTLVFIPFNEFFKYIKATH